MRQNGFFVVFNVVKLLAKENSVKYNLVIIAYKQLLMMS